MVLYKVGQPNEEVRKQVKQKIDEIAKPLDSLGKFEAYIAQIGAITERTDIDIHKKVIIAMCADNGVVEEGISQSGQEVTTFVAEAMGKGVSSVCKMAQVIGADVIPVDVGINNAAEIPGVINKKVMPGTHNFLKEPAMSGEQTRAAIQVGIDMAAYCKEQGYQILGVGEMGIGNTTTSAAVAAVLTGCTVEEMTGRGAGLSDTGLVRKREVIAQGIEFHELRNYDLDGDTQHISSAEAFHILSCVGGLDLAAMAGVFIGAAKVGLPVVIDGVISAVAALLAEKMAPGVKAYMIPSHKSKEPAANLMLKELGLEPILSADMALGEGTGAVMLMGMLDMALALYQTPTKFADISMEQYTRF